MELVVTHDMADFDAIACSVLATKLHPGAVIALGRRLSTPVRDFMALHKDRFPTRRYSEVDASEVERLITVDVRRESRLGDFADVIARVRAGEVDCHVWDHHGAASDDLPASVEHVDKVGAAVTLLVEELRRRGGTLDPIEATLAALAIHTDTGSLTYGNTSPRDAEALAWVLGQGASLRMIDRYLNQAFTATQRQALTGLLSAVRVHTIGGLHVGFAVVPMDKAIDGLAEVTTRALDLEDHAALFALFPIGDKRVQVIARARSNAVDVGGALKSIGGGGHRSAGSAVVKKAAASDVQSRLLDALLADPPQPRVLSELMSSPVHTVAFDTSLRRLAESLATWNHSGVPVVRDGRLVGVISKRDLARAEQDGRLDLPVSSCMSHEVRTAELDTPLEAALSSMVEADVGRLPVLRDGRLVGIVSRSDLLRVLYPEPNP